MLVTGAQIDVVERELSAYLADIGPEDADRLVGDAASLCQRIAGVTSSTSNAAAILALLTVLNAVLEEAGPLIEASLLSDGLGPSTPAARA